MFSIIYCQEFWRKFLIPTYTMLSPQEASNAAVLLRRIPLTGFRFFGFLGHQVAVNSYSDWRFMDIRYFISANAAAS